MAQTDTSNAPLLERWFDFESEEQPLQPLKIEGRLPEWLKGSYYINGPARFRRSGFRYRHWLDGDGFICALHFGEQGVEQVSRFIQTPKLKQEEAAGRPIFRTFGTAFPGDRLRHQVMLEPPVNVSVYPFADFLLAFGEQSLPFRLDPVTLETLGEFDFHGRLNAVSPFSAHPKFDPETGHLVNFGIGFSASRPTLHLYEFDAGGHLLRRRRHPLVWPHSNHDFGLSPRFAIFYLSPLLMNFERFWNEGASVMESLSWEADKGSRLLFLPRHPQEGEAFEIEIGSAHCLHFFNCCENGDHIVADVLELEQPVYQEYQPVPDFFQTKTPGNPVRYRIDFKNRRLAGRTELTYQAGADFPSIDPHQTSRPCDDLWFLGISRTGQPGRKFFDELVRGSWKEKAIVERFRCGPGEYLCGEPAFVARPGRPQSGALIQQHFDGPRDQVEFLIFDAYHLAAGPIARLPFPGKVHPGFHTSFRALRS